MITSYTHIIVPGFSNYTIDEHGRVWSRVKKKFMSPNIHYKTNYLSVILKQQNINKRISIHRLVAESFIPNPNNLPQVNHKDGNKSNNCVNNLEWCTNMENRHHAIVNGLHRQTQIIAVKDVNVFEFKSIADCGRYFGIDNSYICKCLKNSRSIKGYSFYL